VTATTRTWLPAASLAWREVVRFLRQPNRVFAAVLQPALFWGLFGAGFSGSFRQPVDQPFAPRADQDFLEYLFPGAAVLIVLFTAIFSTISVIEDRQAGFLQSVLVAPVSRAGIVLGKVAGGATLALVQALVFLLLAPLAGVPLTLVGALGAAGALALTAVALTALGLAVAWPSDSVQGFHAVMMVFLMPMWLLSGAFFPLTGVPGWLEWVMRANPLTYGVALVRTALYRGDVGGLGLPPLWLSLGVTALFGAVALCVCAALVARRTEGDLR
jgi:ABC-2 type transport system permease protein